MKSNKKQVWVANEDLSRDADWVKASSNEFASTIPEVVADVSEAKDGSRRDFLKLLGFSLSAAAVASCEIPVKKAIPYVISPEEIVPGNATYYASSYVQGGDYCPVVVKTREGRPIKIEGNKQSTMTSGGTSARAQAMVLSLYSTYRFKYPAQLKEDALSPMTWDEMDAKIKSALNADTQIRLVGHTNMSPSIERAINEFVTAFPNAKHVSYDPVSSTAMLLANEADFGQKVIPGYHFDKAKVIVSFNADFLGTWISPVEFSKQYVSNRRVTKAEGAKMSYHVQVECGMTLTGSNADNRILTKPSEQGAAIVHLYNEVAAKMGGQSIASLKLNEKAKNNLNKVASTLVKNKGNSLIVSASNNVAEQKIVNAINMLLDNYGTSLDFDSASYQRKGDDRNVQTLVQELKSGSVDAVIIMDANPVFELPNGVDFAAGMKKVKTRIALGQSLNETFLQCNWIAPTNHILEDWGDVNPKRGTYSFVQPTINPLFKTRNMGQSLLSWFDSSLDNNADQPYYEYLKSFWIEKLGGIEAFDKALNAGVLEMDEAEEAATYVGDVASLSSEVSKPANSEYEISFFETVNMGVGQFADNPWLMELPDPVTRCVWGNYVSVPIHFDGDRNFIAFKGVKDDGELLPFTIGNSEERSLAVVKQFGQMPGTFSMALGYGRAVAGATGAQIGYDMQPDLVIENGLTQYYTTKVSVGERLNEVEENFACVQHHHTLGVTDVEDSTGDVINADEAALVNDAFKWLTKGFQGALTERSILMHSNIKEVAPYQEELQEKRAEFEKLNSYTLYPYEQYKENLYDQGHHWGMHVDLNSCTGCAACVVACMAENNVPVVGKKEVMRHHEMTWLKIDRYYYGDVDNPSVAYQPMMCQHCDNAPCENVCPVNATNHSSEGLNQMAYNRCIGTRYCANNCPYKVRRFNWLDYTTADLFGSNEYKLTEAEDLPFYADNLTRMVLNPDVTVRARGVIEKCSFCVQRLQAGKLSAKSEGRKLEDSDISTACQAACSTNAITFGDTNNKESALVERNSAPLNYVVLEEINVRSSVTYSTIINNRDESFDA